MIPLSPRRARFLVSLAPTIAPDVATLDTAGRARFESIVTRALDERPAQVRRQLGLLLDLVRFAPLLRYGRPFARLDAHRQAAWLRWLEGAPIVRLRAGFWGLKTLVYMGYYGQPHVWGSLGYRPFSRASSSGRDPGAERDV
ncbi:MAG: hypothetical protein JSV80_05175 [Acidobacteriota bacterium]|nr:MAG: hypothetical protein JSV80_05175 [Acidobacteriota bacterium]